MSIPKRLISVKLKTIPTFSRLLARSRRSPWRHCGRWASLRLAGSPAHCISFVIDGILDAGQRILILAFRIEHGIEAADGLLDLGVFAFTQAFFFQVDELGLDVPFFEIADGFLGIKALFVPKIWIFMGFLLMSSGLRAVDLLFRGFFFFISFDFSPQLVGCRFPLYGISLAFIT